MNTRMIKNGRVKPIVFLPELIAPDEKFAFITEQSVENRMVKPYYMISTYGRVFNIYSRKFLRPALGTDDHYYLALATENGQRNFRIARLVMLTFNYFHGCESYLVNHIDGKPYANYYEGYYPDRITNLEWSTYSDNAIHAIASGLKECKRGENCHASKLTDKEVIEICERIQAGELMTLIAEDMGINPNVVYSINAGRAWTHISCNYNFPTRKLKRK